jgi:ribose/xylose/arabinose/galactoside ABC-type transport system permease subunit
MIEVKASSTSLPPTPRAWPALVRYRLRSSLYVVFAALLLVAGALSPAFLRPSNLANMVQQVAPLGIVVIGQTLVILVRGLDLSVASVMATAAVVATAFHGEPRDVGPIIGVALAIGVLVGLVNGLLVTKRSVSPFLATLATWMVLEGMRYVYNGGAPSGNVPRFFRVVGSQSFHGVPVNVVALAGIASAGVLLLGRSSFGRRVYLVGGNPTMARLVGIHVDRVVIVCYVLSGALAALAGLVLSGFVGLVDNFVGRGFELDSIIAAVLGGVALSGGRGTIAGALVGAAILVSISNAVLMLGLPIEMQLVIKGTVIVAAAALHAVER